MEDDRLVGEFFFNEAYVAIDTNGDKELEDEDEVAVTDGTIQVSGTYPEYTLVYDLTLANGTALRGSFVFDSDNAVIDD